MSKILVIDDDFGLRRTLETALKLFGYEVSVVETGKDGIDRVREWRPDLVLCDVNMPGMDGREVLKILRNDPNLTNLQIVLMTGDQLANPQREGMNLGADDYLPKPFEIAQLKTCVEARFRRAKTYRRLEEGMIRRHSELFGSTLPHEFMTPLNGILGFAEILKQDFEKIPREESLHMLSDIEICARRLYRTLTNYITLVTIENASTETAPSQESVIEPEQAMQAISATAQLIAEKEQRSYDLELEVEPLKARCNDADLRRIVEHLVENAFGYSLANTRIKVSYKLNQGRPTLTVADQGRGMTADQVAQIGLFMQFERKRFEQQGLGIGLSIVKRLIERHRAELRVDSVPNQGTTIAVAFKPA